MKWLAVVALTCLTIGCHRGGGIGTAAAESNYGGAVTLRVVNRSWMDVTVYLQQWAHRDHVGTATAALTTEFHVPLRRISEGGEYRLLGDPIGSRESVRSEPLRAEDGDVVTWTLEDNLARSFVEVRLPPVIPKSAVPVPTSASDDGTSDLLSRADSRSRLFRQEESRITRIRRIVRRGLETPRGAPVLFFKESMTSRRDLAPRVRAIRAIRAIRD